MYPVHHDDRAFGRVHHGLELRGGRHGAGRVVRARQEHQVRLAELDGAREAVHREAPARVERHLEHALAARASAQLVHHEGGRGRHDRDRVVRPPRPREGREQERDDLVAAHTDQDLLGVDLRPPSDGLTELARGGIGVALRGRSTRRPRRRRRLASSGSRGGASFASRPNAILRRAWAGTRTARRAPAGAGPLRAKPDMRTHFRTSSGHVHWHPVARIGSGTDRCPPGHICGGIPLRGSRSASRRPRPAEVNSARPHPTRPLCGGPTFPNGLALECLRVSPGFASDARRGKPSTSICRSRNSSVRTRRRRPSSALLESGRVHHAYRFEGPEGVGEGTRGFLAGPSASSASAARSPGRRMQRAQRSASRSRNKIHRCRSISDVVLIQRGLYKGVIGGGGVGRDQHRADPARGCSSGRGFLRTRARTWCSSCATADELTQRGGERAVEDARRTDSAHSLRAL